MPRLTFTTRVSRFVYSHPKKPSDWGGQTGGGTGRILAHEMAGGGKGWPSLLPRLVWQEKPRSRSVQRCRDAGAIPTGARLGKGARDGTALVCGVPRGCFPLGRIPQGGTPLRRGFRGANPCRAVAARSEAGILRDGFGVPLARNIACDV
jgi:hypothetical protein